MSHIAAAKQVAAALSHNFSIALPLAHHCICFHLSLTMHVSTANTSPNANRAGASKVAALEARIASLEEELSQTRLQLACAKSSEDNLKLELSKAANNEESRTGCKRVHKSITHTVPTKDPFSRKRKHPKLNPASCASGLELLGGLSQPGSLWVVPLMLRQNASGIDSASKHNADWAS